MPNRSTVAGPAPRPRRPAAGALLAAGLLAIAGLACGSGGKSKGQTPPPPEVPPILSGAGTPTGTPATGRIGPAGGVISSPDALIEVSVPAGALGRQVELSIQPITPTAIGAVGGAYRIRPEGVRLARPVTILLHGPEKYASGTSINDLGIAYQDASGFWFRVKGVKRDAAANTLSVESDHFSDWGLVVNAGVPGLYGPFTLNQAIPDAGPSFQASGTATLFYQANDATRTLYLSTGSIAVPAQVAWQGMTCTPATTQSTLQPTVAQVFATTPAKFSWSLNGEWPLTCTNGVDPPVPDFMSAVFDTFGVNLIGCARSYDTMQPLAIGTDHVQGTYVIDCGVNGKVTASWDLVACVPGVACTSPQACYGAAISCASGTPVCAVTAPLPTGTSCGTGLQCDGAGTCACAQGADCTLAGACFTSQYQCATGSPVCTQSTTPVAAGTSCGTNLVCNGAGACVACAQGADCTPANACVTSQTQCASGAPVCTASTTPVAAGATCGTGLECDGAGACVCAQGLDCTSPSACVTSQYQCATGSPVCTASTTPVAAGTSCGTDLVCNGAGSCVACTQGADCTPPNACVTSQYQCATGSPVCTASTTPVAAGTSCGTGLQCNGAGACVCAQGLDCTPANACVTSQYQCATGSPVCTASTTPVAAGTSCGTNMVCSDAGACVSCTQGADCTPAGACVTSQYQCATGSPVCTATATPVAAGTSCGTNLVCDGTGSCVACTQGQDCTQANTCGLVSQIQCGSGAPVCTPTAMQVAAGTSCGTNLVCDGTGSCVACTQGQDCTQANTCGLVSQLQCGSGAPVCTATTSLVAAGTSCGTNLVCDGTGNCVACTEGQDCTPPDTCSFLSQFQCSSGGPVCTSTTTPVPNGYACGTLLNCATGVCTCVSGTACPPSDACHTGAITCDLANNPTCVQTPLPDGTACGPLLSCNAGACTCVAGQTCVSANPCQDAAITCDVTNTVATCTDTGPKTDGTSCINSLGAQSTCLAGVCQ